MALLILLAVLLILTHRCYSDLQCEFGTWSVDTLECVAVGGKKNQLSTSFEVTRNDLATVRTLGNHDWSKIRTVSLKNTKLVALDLTFFANASSVITLDLSGNELFFPNDIHKFLPNLETLNLSGSGVHNHIEVEKLPNLKMLDVSNTYLSTSNAYSVGTGVFNSFRRINVLNLSHSQDIDLSVLTLGPSLRSLNVSHTAVTLKEDCLQRAINLKTLVMTHAGLSDIPARAFRGTEITRIDLSHNNLSADSLDKLENSMIYVDVSHNNLSSLNKPYGLKYKLRTINLSFNNITHLHSRIFDYTEQLYILNISNNLLTSLNYKMFSRILKLEILDLSYNLLTDLNGLTFSELVKLDTLNLAGNKLKTLDTALFQKNVILRHLSLSNNVLESLDIRTFAHLNVTRIIDLRYNLLTRLPEELLHLGNLEHLILSCNRLTFLPPQFYEASADYSDWKVYLQGNPWKCKCLQPMIDALENYQFDQKYFNTGSYPSCFVGENSKPSDVCNDDPLTAQDYVNWEQIAKNSGIIC